MKKLLASLLIATILVGSTSGLLVHAASKVGETSTPTVFGTTSDEPNPERS